ncbi:LPS assembly lipoprotein LptE [Pseudosulfitobacter koreensis]|uniref:LPS assembly lipoprotein LptE n=1 Tax=Pseudosulfitobacter koreensis TaxID=2968472 RepID=A0ABT1Z132_9RHOB|nr:LPS assembly lipoprotein LptE [Pseudosulfitobacter koreense]MCR8826845.1 LPS assembly lipoprotein LptE [Pseudosulfitobacter koreense]
MSLYRTLLALPLLAACGFAPVYGPQGAGTALQGRVLVEAPDTRDDQLLLQQIERRLGRAATPTFDLGIDLIVTQEGLAIDADGDIDRYNLLGTATYVLTSSENGAVIGTGTVTNFTGYSATGTTVATLAAERDARKRLMTILGDMIVDRLIATKL